MERPEVNRERLAKQFMDLVRIDSVSKEEGQLGQTLIGLLSDLGLQTDVDHAGDAVGGDIGNVIGYYSGNRDVEPLLLAAHLDTVEPGRGVEPMLKAGVFSSSGDTILGADDKSAVAIILEVLQCIKEQQLPCGPLEIVFSICEEIGLLGAKHLAYDKLSARMGYALDTSNPDVLVHQAPAMNSLTFRIHGKAAHAGSSPEKGINAISLASKAIAQLELGRIDSETTCNIGSIEGGRATNIVPSEVVVKGEVRSHDSEKLERQTAAMVATFESVIQSYKKGAAVDLPRLEMDIERDYDKLYVSPEHRVVTLARSAAANLGRDLIATASGGGSDANVMNAHGLSIVILGTGMENVHTVNETIRLDDMVRSAALVLEIIREHANHQ